MGKDEGTMLRIAVVVLLVVASLAYPVLWIVTVLVVGGMLSGDHASDASKPDIREIVDRHISSTDPKWHARLQGRCESPAEVAFLNAMVSVFELKPQKGVLQGNGITLDLQVSIPPYRADFVACGWLVIEIDGKAYHSSVDAVARDRERDVFMESLSYTVLRISAKSVFVAPQQMIAQVRAAIAEGRPTAEHATQADSNAKSKGVMETVTDFLSQVNSKVDRIKSVQEAMSGPELTFHLEQVHISQTVEIARRRIELERYIGDDLEMQKSYDKFSAELEGSFRRFDEEASSIASNESQKTKRVPCLSEPSRHENAMVNEAIENAYRRLLAERLAFLKAKRRTMSEDRNLSRLTQNALEESGYSSLWQLIAP